MLVIGHGDNAGYLKVSHRAQRSRLRQFDQRVQLAHLAFGDVSADAMERKDDGTCRIECDDIVDLAMLCDPGDGVIARVAGCHSCSIQNVIPNASPPVERLRFPPMFE